MTRDEFEEARRAVFPQGWVPATTLLSDPQLLHAFANEVERRALSRCPLSGGWLIASAIVLYLAVIGAAYATVMAGGLVLGVR